MTSVPIWAQPLPNDLPHEPRMNADLFTARHNEDYDASEMRDNPMALHQVLKKRKE